MKVRKLVYSLTFALTLSFSLSAQYSLKAYVKTTAGNSSHPLEFAILQLRSQSDSLARRPMFSTLTDSSGYFSFSISTPGIYSLSASLVGFKQRIISFSIKEDSLVNDLGMIFLEKDSVTLKGVQVVANRKLIERKIDRLVFNVEASPVAGSGSVWDALRYTPGVILSSRDDILANGQSATVYIDDRPLKLAPVDVASFLKSLPALSIISIEVIDHPPSSFDAEGGVVINIKTNKKLSQGFTGSVSAQYQQAFYAKNSNSLNINYKGRKYWITGNFNLNTGKYHSLEDDYYNYIALAQPTYWQLAQRKRNKGTSFTYRTELFYDISSRSSVILGVDGMSSSSNTNNNVNTRIFNQAMKLDSTQTAISDLRSPIGFFSANGTYKLRIDSVGDQFQVSADYTIYNSSSNQQLGSRSYDTNNFQKDTKLIKVDSKQDIEIATAKMDYTNVMKKGLKIDGGGKITYIKTNNPFVFQDSVNNQFVTNILLSNKFRYQEHTYAAYVSFNKEFKKIKLYGGLRAEKTYTSTFSETLNQTNKNNYFRLFPTFLLQYTAGKKDVINISYNKRISRPDYWRLNPFKHFVSDNYYLTGDPFLKPAVSQTFSISNLFKGQYYSSVFYSTTKNRFTNATVQDYNRNILIDTQYNIRSSSFYGFDLYIPVRIRKFVEINNYFYIANRDNKIILQNQTINKKIVRYFDQTNLVFTLSQKRNIKMEISSLYTSKDVVGVWKFDDMYNLSTTLRMPFNNNKISLSLSVSDIFYTNNYHVTVNYLDQANGFEERNETRLFSARLTYRFGTRKKVESKSFNRINTEETDRLRK